MQKCKAQRNMARRLGGWVAGWLGGWVAGRLEPPPPPPAPSPPLTGTRPELRSIFLLMLPTKFFKKFNIRFIRIPV